jgi:hypothetical protein
MQRRYHRRPVPLLVIPKRRQARTTSSRWRRHRPDARSSRHCLTFA